MKNIFAYTEPIPVRGYPSYLSVNHIDTEADENIVITVRSSGNSGAPQEVRLTPQMCEALVYGLAAAIHSGESAHSAAPAPDIDSMVNRFLGWRLPQHFYPDCYVSFDREKASQSPHGWPSGTNLLTAEQARKMFEYVIASTPCQVEFHTEGTAHENTTSTR